MESLLPLIIQLISGAAGGNIAGALLKNISLGTVGNSIAGILGGAGGAQVLGPLLGGVLGAGGGGMGDILTQVASGGVGGGVLMAIIGVLKSLLAK